MMKKRRKKRYAIKQNQESGYVNKRIEFYTMKGCDPCDDALKDLIPFAKEQELRLDIIPVDENTKVENVPQICVVDERDGVETRKCIEGYNDDLVKNVEGMIEEIDAHKGDLRKPVEDERKEKVERRLKTL